MWTTHKIGASPRQAHIPFICEPVGATGGIIANLYGAE